MNFVPDNLKPEFGANTVFSSRICDMPQIAVKCGLYFRLGDTVKIRIVDITL
jgi:hypothetical protein